ncbi:NACHT domain-containing protein [Mycena venus]|uniref:NACHT domain-containing protein n=1 Tax=Mycena venus TaxID=2733690 RepID=A0A8H7CNH6_9AGAR|nr:NACHT domain-containing protein [Mycena venus]
MVHFQRKCIIDVRVLLTVEPGNVWGAGLHGGHPSAVNPAHIRPGNYFEPMSSGHGVPSCAESIPLLQNQGPSQHHFALPWNSQFPALEYPTSSHTPVGNQRCPLQYYSADFELGPGRSRDYYPAEPNFGAQLDINGNNLFPWNRLPDAAPTSINGGTFISGNMYNIKRHGETGLHILHRAIAGGTFYDSAERFPQPRCHPETRKKLLDVLWNWACGIEPPRKWTSEDDEYDPWQDDEHFESLSEGDSSDPTSSFEDDVDHQAVPCTDEHKGRSSILWLHGPAGSGKSAIAQSFCQRLKADGRLGDSFFFKRGHSSRGNAKQLFPTIVCQLALLPELKLLISQRIENDPAIADRSFSDQLQELIVEPCQNSSLAQPVSVVIDGLDEGDGEEIQQEVLRSIGNAVHREDFPILFFIASRPESHIRETFAEPGLHGIHRPLNVNQSFQDVRRYLLDEFDRIHREHQTMAAVPSPWPRSEIVQNLEKRSSGYFIYASTVVKFIDDKRFRPGDRLDVVLGIENSISGSPFGTLDQLYHQILSAVPLDFRPKLIEILAFISSKIALEYSYTEHLLDLNSGDLPLILRDLVSVVHLQEGFLPCVRVHHASFLDFLRDPARSGPFYIGSSQCHNLTYRILEALSSGRDEANDLCW